MKRRSFGLYLIIQLTLVLLKLIDVFDLSWNLVLFPTTMPLCILGIAVGVVFLITGKYDNINTK